jgi:hypothetical protein
MRARGRFRGAIAGIWIGIAVAAIGWSRPMRVAAETVAPEGTVLLVDAPELREKPAAFDLAELKALPATSVTTTTPWTAGEDRYEGVRIRDLLERLHAAGTAVIAEAVDDYQTRIPMEDVRDYDVIIAYAMDGKPLPLDNKGPLWIIYPYSQHARLQKDLYFARSVWQLKRLIVQ